MDGWLQKLRNPRTWLALSAIVGAILFIKLQSSRGVDRASPELSAASTNALEAAPKERFPLVKVRRSLKTKVVGQRDDEAPPVPPKELFELTHYAAPLGSNPAYVTPARGTTRGPAILWIIGGFGWGLGSTPWDKATRANDQSARQFREAGIITMYPALRGASQSPGRSECFLGEVDDILAAAEYLAKRPDVDPKRIYLGGHSTGGTLALLAAASTDRFRAVFALGPVADPRQYGESGCMDPNISEEEASPRAPVRWLGYIESPTFVIEGEEGNATEFPLMKAQSGSAPVHFIEIAGSDHFRVIAPALEVAAKAISADRGERATLNVSEQAIAEAMQGNR